MITEATATPLPNLPSPQVETFKQKSTNPLLIVGIALLALGALAILAVSLWGGPILTNTIVAVSFSKAVETIALTATGTILLIGIATLFTGGVLTVIGRG